MCCIGEAVGISMPASCGIQLYQSVYSWHQDQVKFWQAWYKKVCMKRGYMELLCTVGTWPVFYKHIAIWQSYHICVCVCVYVCVYVWVYVCECVCVWVRACTLFVTQSDKRGLIAGKYWYDLYLNFCTSYTILQISQWISALSDRNFRAHIKLKNMDWQ